MIETIEKNQHHIARVQLQNRLAEIDRDPDELQDFIAELYIGHGENPHIMYAAATYLTSISYLDRRDANEQPMLPEHRDAQRAFTTYARLMSMLMHEREAPLYAHDERIRRRFAGTREELAFHATLAYSTAQGADIVALPAPAKLDFTGADEATDVQIFFPESDELPLEIQVKLHPGGEESVDRYHPRIPVLSLSTVLGSMDKAAEVRGLIRDIGSREDCQHGATRLPKREHVILLDASASILQAAREWGSA